MKKAVIIGAGNVAWNLAHTLPSCGCAVVQIFSRREQSAQALAMDIGADFTADFSQICYDADFYIYAVSDDALSAVIKQVKVNFGLHLHTSGSVEMSVFEGQKENFGVLYPFQTFSKQKLVDMKNIPIFIESNSEKNLEIISDFANKISNKIFKINSLQRKDIHLAGVFASNFTNYLYSVAGDLLQKNDLPFALLLPLIEESTNKLHFMPPKQAQTGPAMRGDKKIIDKHLQMLADDKDLCEIYRLMSDKIFENSK
jgi:predicted short-subunit dehydrogenase-like oxidoreductase (DUF2520 family)